jgi:hypothetical protein
MCLMTSEGKFSNEYVGTIIGVSVRCILEQSLGYRFDAFWKSQIQDDAGSAQFDLSVEPVAGDDTGASGASSTGVAAVACMAVSGLLALL